MSRGPPAKLDRAKVRQDFEAVVNMSAAELAEWLSTDDSRKVGWKGADGTATESVGHACGRKTVRLLAKPATELDDDDYLHMRRTVGFVRRLSAQRPENIYTSRWRYSLMNWGHDPVKEDR